MSTALEQKHRFMVDVVLFMGILEDEHVRLESRIQNFTGERWRGGGGANHQDSADEDVEDEEDDEEVRRGGIKECYAMSCYAILCYYIL